MARIAKSASLKHGWRSGLEEQVARQLLRYGIDATYESHVIGFTEPAQQRRYTPDYVLPNGIIIETKGRFLTADRKKHKLIRAEHPELDIRFVFSNSRAKIGKKSATTYGMWCEQFGFQYADKLVPVEWIREPVDPVRLAAIMRLAKEKK